MGFFKKMEMKLLLAIAASVLIFGTAQTPVSVYADEVLNTAEYSEIIGENLTENAVDDSLDESVENVPENELESVEEETESNVEMTWEEFLNEIQNKADEYGKGDEWAETMEDIKHAVSEKKFDGLFWVNILELVALAFYIIYRVVSNISLKLVIAKVDTLIKKINELTSSTNELIDEAKGVEDDEKKILNAFKKERKALEYTNEALKNMIDGIKFTPEKKTAALRALNKANECLDGRKEETKA